MEGDLILWTAIVRIAIWVLVIGGGIIFRRPLTVLVGLLMILANVLAVLNDRPSAGLVAIISTGLIAWLLVDRLVWGEGMEHRRAFHERFLRRAKS